jgi:hypothetical protein
VSRIEKEMDHLLRQLGYDKGTINERMVQLNLDLQPKEPCPMRYEPEQRLYFQRQMSLKSYL